MIPNEEGNYYYLFYRIWRIQHHLTRIAHASLLFHDDLLAYI